MTEDLTHRALATQAFNASWSLLERDRTEAEDLELLEVAFTSRHHWRQEGGPQQIAIADWMVSRCCSELGDGALALRFAVAALAAAPPDARRAAHVLAEETDDEDRALIEAQLASVPPAR